MHLYGDSVLHRDYNLRSDPSQPATVGNEQPRKQRGGKRGGKRGTKRKNPTPRDVYSFQAPDPLTQAALSKTLPPPQENRPISEEHIQWCLQTNNVDDFRVWDAANNLPVYKPPAERLANSNQNVQKLLFEEPRFIVKKPELVKCGLLQMPHEAKCRETEKSWDTMIDPGLYLPPSVQRREGMRRMREQRLRAGGAGASIGAVVGGGGGCSHGEEGGGSSQEDEIQEIVTIYNPPSSCDPNLWMDPNKKKPSPVTLHPEESEAVQRFLSGPLPGLMPNPDSADFQLYRSTFEKNRWWFLFLVLFECSTKSFKNCEPVLVILTLYIFRYKQFYFIQMYDILDRAQFVYNYT